MTLHRFEPVPHRFLKNAVANPGATAVATADGPLTYDTLRNDVLAAVHALRALDVMQGDRVAVLWPTEYAHTVFDLAILAAGAVAVPIYETDSPAQIQWILTDAAPVGVLCHAAHLERLNASIDASGARPWVQTSLEGSEGFDPAAVELVARRIIDELTPDAPAAIIYTSGTTGNPKGCTLSHGNLSFAVHAATEALPQLLGAGQRTVLFLPLAHVFAKVVQYGCVCAGVEVAYSTPATIVEDLALYRPTWLTVVPRVLEKVLASARAQATGPKAKIFALAERTAVAVAAHREAGTKLPARLKAAHAVCDKLVYSKLRDRLGGELRFVLSGGAPLDAHLDRFFTGANVTVLEGYGLTETSAAHTVSTPAAKRAGTVGQALEGTKVLIHDGEVLLAGPNVFAGYWQNDQATDAAFVTIDGDRWFRSGDQGVLSDGFLSITGRIKELIVTANGKNVQPTGLEEVVVRHAAFSQCVVIGDNRPFIAALLALDPAWLVTNDISTPSLDHPLIAQAVSEALAQANATVSQAEAIKACRLLPHELSVDAGELTATLKTKRPAVMKIHHELVEDIYR
jgi:long-chain acyl-CoA synthetase